MSKECGSCSLCCKVLAVPELEKPGNTWCKDCNKSGGCAIYESRPSICRDFQCLWLQFDDMPDELQPNRCKVILTPTKDNHEQGIVAHVDPAYPDAYRRPAVAEFLERAGRKVPVFVVIGNDARKAVGPHSQKLVNDLLRKKAGQHMPTDIATTAQDSAVMTDELREQLLSTASRLGFVVAFKK